MSPFSLHREFERLKDDSDREAEATLRRTLSRLPADVLEFALARCRFAAVGPDIVAQTLPPDDRWVILLREGEMDESVVAHEIAHAYRGHVRSTAADEAAQEAEARALARLWGVAGLGTDDGAYG